MSELVALIKRLEQARIHVSLDRGRLKITSPPGALTGGIRQQLQLHKSGLLNFLQEVNLTKSVDEPLPLDPLLHHLAEGGGGPPVFLVPGIGGTCNCFLALAQMLSGKCTLFGLQSPGFVGEVAAQAIPQTAERMAEAIRSAIPVGDYILSGHSMGGLIALEITRLLVAEGREPKQLILLDTFPPSPHETATQARQAFAQMLVMELEVLVGTKLRNRPDFESSSLDSLVAHLSRPDTWGEPEEGFDATLVADTVRVVWANHQSFHRYSPSVLRTTTTLVEARNPGWNPAHTFWNSWLPNLNIFKVDADHFSMLGAENVHQLVPLFLD